MARTRRGTGSLLRTPHQARVLESTPLLADQDPPSVIHGLTTRGRRWAVAAAEAAERRTFTLSSTLMLIMAALERVTFKLLLDRMAPFRAFLAETVVLMYMLVSGAALLYKLLFTEDVAKEMWEFPQWKVAAIAAIDALHLFLMFLGGAQITPAQTVLLLQLQVPLVMILSGALRCRCGAGVKRNHVLGSLGIALSVALASTSRSASTACLLTYGVSALPAALSTLLKERAMIDFGKPMEPMLMNLMLAVYQMAFAVALSPIAFRMQALGARWEDFPWERLQTATSDAMRCWLWFQDPSDGAYLLPTECGGAIFITLAYAVSVISLPRFAAGVLLSGDVRYVYRVVVAATGLSVVLLVLVLGDHDGLLGTSLKPLEAVSLALLLPSLLLYHQQQEPDTEIVTQYDTYDP